MALTHVLPATDHYLKLINRFPLRRIHDAEELEIATSLVDELRSKGRLEEGERDYLEVLCDQIERYEDETESFPSLSIPDRIRYVMDCRGFNQSQLATAVGIPGSTISEVLSGQRDLSKANITDLARFFSVSPAYFMPE